jgi:hypothetical protein
MRHARCTDVHAPLAADEEKTMQEQPNQSPSQEGGNGNQREGGLSARTEEAAGRAREAAIERVEQARDRAREGIDRGKQQMADRIRRLGSALHSASDDLREEDSAIARYGDMASETIERAANYVGSADLKTTVRDVENFARREPALFFGGAFLLGLAAGRFLRSSAGRSEKGEGSRSPRTGPLPDTATDWPKPPPAPPISVSSGETQGVFDTDTARWASPGDVRGEGPDPAGVRGRRPT